MECWGKGSLEYWSSGAKADWKDKRHWWDLIFPTGEPNRPSFPSGVVPMASGEARGIACLLRAPRV